MGFFDKLREPLFLKKTSSAQRQLEQLQAVDSARLPDDLKAQLEREIKLVSLGIRGEEAIEYELRNSHIPMYVLHDLYLEYNSLSAQIDYLVITRGRNYIIECKNLYGDIEINNKGDFIRSVSFGGGKPNKEGIYSPITQNRRHLDLIKQLRLQEQSMFAKAGFEKPFYDNYLSVIVLSNPKTILNDRYAKNEIKSQVIRADALIDYIRKANTTTKSCSDRQMESLANYFLYTHIERDIDYTEKYRSGYRPEPIKTVQEQPKKEEPSPALHDDKTCPECRAAMVLRTAKKGDNAGRQFWGCSQYPKCRTTITPDTPAFGIKELERKFHDELLRRCRVIRDNGYPPKWLESETKKRGGYMTAKRLIHPEPSLGFKNLADKGLLKYSMEALVLQPEYAPLFTENERDICRRLLEAHGYIP